MTIRRLDPEEWRDYFDLLSKAQPEAQVEIEVLGPEVGDQYAVEWAQWHGATYDPESLTLDVFMETLDHRIPGPREIHVDDADTAHLSFRVVDGGGNTQLVRLRTAQLPTNEGAEAWPPPWQSRHLLGP